MSKQPVMLFRRPPAPVFLTSGLMLTTLGPFSSNQNHIFVMYTHGRTLKTYCRPVILIQPFEPLFELAYSLSCFRVVKFEPQGLVVHTWEDTIIWWPAINSSLHFCPLAGRPWGVAGRPPPEKALGRPHSSQYILYSYIVVSPKYLWHPGDILRGKAWVHFPPLYTPPFVHIRGLPTQSLGLEKFGSSISLSISLKLSSFGLICSSTPSTTFTTSISAAKEGFSVAKKQQTQVKKQRKTCLQG